MDNSVTNEVFQNPLSFERASIYDVSTTGVTEMRQTVTEKIISAHLVEGNAQKGKEIAIRIDQTLTQDATGTMAYLEFETLNIDRARTELSVSYIDHNTLQIGFENADDHAYLTSIAQKYGILLSRAG